MKENRGCRRAISGGFRICSAAASDIMGRVKVSMYRILIVDDEFLVRLGLKTTIDWNAHGYDVVGEASNGNEALEMVASLKPDIILVDIKMPLMDGLDFIKRAKEISRDLSFLILTNYESFQYAKRAVQLGVSQYLLKSEINGEVLLAALEEITKGYQEQAKRSRGSDWERMKYLSSSLSRGQINRPIAEERLEIPPRGLFPNPTYAVIKYHCNISSMNEQSIGMLSKTMASLVTAEYPGVTYVEVFFQMHYYLTLIVPVDRDVDISVFFRDKSQMIARKIKYYFSAALRGGISEALPPEKIPEMLNQAERARRSCFFGNEPFIMYDSGFQGQLREMEKVHVSSSRTAAFLTDGDYEGIRSYVRNIFEILRRQMNYANVRHAFFDFLSNGKSFLEKLDGEEKELLSARLDYDNWNALTSIDEAENYIYDVFEMLIQQTHDGGARYSISVRKSISYIEENYALNITLQDVADHVSISKNYLSMLFKQETGINFVSYLNRYRIEKAKQLLTTTNMKIYEIADSVGFYSPYYFSKVFKEITKMQCKEYRDKYSVIEQEED